MKYLITGIEGFVGSYLLEAALDFGGEVFGTYFDESTLTDIAKDKCKLKQIDVRDEQYLASFIAQAQPDVLFHLAAQSSAAVSWKKPLLTMDVNINGTVNVLESVRKSLPDCRIVMIGSSEEYGIVDPDDNPIDEDHALSPGNPYSVSKATCEELCKLYIKSYDMDIVLTRSFNHIGLRQSIIFVIADFAHRIAEISKGERSSNFMVGNLDAQRDFTDVRDVVKAYLTIAKKGASGEVFNVGSGVTKSIKHYLDYMISREKIDVNIIADKARMRPSDNPVICCNNSKLMQLGWNQSFDIYNTIDDMIDYWKFK